jgi:hypothetical protein
MGREVLAELWVGRPHVPVGDEPLVHLVADVAGASASAATILHPPSSAVPQVNWRASPLLPLQKLRFA